MHQITTSRMVLRPGRADDVHAVHDIYCREPAMRYWDTLPHKSISETQKLLDRMRTPGPDTRYFVVEHHDRVIGTAGFWRDSEIGYILHPDHWGQGLGTELLHALIGFGFDTCLFERITAEVDPQNAASLSMLRKVGFAETGREKNTLQLGGKWFDSVYLALPRPPDRP